MPCLSIGNSLQTFWVMANERPAPRVHSLTTLTWPLYQGLFEISSKTPEGGPAVTDIQNRQQPMTTGVSRLSAHARNIHIMLFPAGCPD